MKKVNLTLQCEDDPLEQSIYSEIEPNGLRFLKSQLLVSHKGIQNYQGHSIGSIKPSQIQYFYKQIGRGATCVVQQGFYKPQNVKVAIKTINIYDKQKRHQLINDINTLLELKGIQQYQCPFLVKLYGAFYQDGLVRVILEYMEMGSLADVLNKIKTIKKKPIIVQPILAKIAVQILSGLSYLHLNNRIHRDIKPENVLLNKKGQVKLTDFGITRQLQFTIELCNTFVGTYAYMSPQRIQGKKYNFKSDIWSFGVMIYQLYSGYSPFPSSNYIQSVSLVTEFRIQPTFQGSVCRKIFMTGPVPLNCCLIDGYNKT